MISERDVIYVTKKQASVAVVALVAFCILVFMLGYFWGKQHMLDGFGQRIAQESIQDQADYEIMMQSFADRTRTDAAVDCPEDVVSKPQDDADDIPSVESEPEVAPAPVVEKQKNNKSSKSSEIKHPSKKHSAILVGFGTKQSAMAFVQRLQNHDIIVHIKTRVSKSASGKMKKNWYQVVTKSYDSKDELEQVIANIRKFERLKNSDIKIS